MTEIKDFKEKIEHKIRENVNSEVKIITKRIRRKMFFQLYTLPWIMVVGILLFKTGAELKRANEKQNILLNTHSNLVEKIRISGLNHDTQNKNEVYSRNGPSNKNEITSSIDQILSPMPKTNDFIPEAKESKTKSETNHKSLNEDSHAVAMECSKSDVFTKENLELSRKIKYNIEEEIVSGVNRVINYEINRFLKNSSDSGNKITKQEIENLRENIKTGATGIITNCFEGFKTYNRINNKK